MKKINSKNTCSKCGKRKTMGICTGCGEYSGKCECKKIEKEAREIAHAMTDHLVWEDRFDATNF